MRSNWTDAERTSAYHQALDAFNASAFAVTRRFHEHPKPLQQAEIAAVARHLPRDGALLEVGTGTGVLPHAFHLMGARVSSVDLPPEGGAPLARLRDLGIDGAWAEVGPQRLPYDDGRFDVVFAGDVVEHIPGSPRPFMDELARVLKPGGWLVVTTPNAVRLPVRIKVMLGHSNWMPLSEFYHLPNNPGHHKEYVAIELADLMRRTGLGEVSVGFVEDTLARANVATSLSDIQTKNRFAGERTRSSRIRWTNPMEYVRLTLLGVVGLLPPLRSALLAEARKPVV